MKIKIDKMELRNVKFPKLSIVFKEYVISFNIWIFSEFGQILVLDKMDLLLLDFVILW